MKKQTKQLAILMFGTTFMLSGPAFGQGSTTGQDSIPRGNTWGVDSLVMPDQRPQQGVGEQEGDQQGAGQYGTSQQGAGQQDTMHGSHGMQGSQSMQDTARGSRWHQDTLRRDTVQGGITIDTLQGGIDADTLQGSDMMPDTMQGSYDRSLEPDNTGVNKRDRDDNSMTADEQGQSAEDIELTRKIRRAIMDDDSLSTYAKNVKIITKDGMVTLRGPVRSEQEKTVIESKATSVAGASKVTNEIEVKAADPSKDN